VKHLVEVSSFLIEKKIRDLSAKVLIDHEAGTESAREEEATKDVNLQAAIDKTSLALAIRKVGLYSEHNFREREGKYDHMADIRGHEDDEPMTSNQGGVVHDLDGHSRYSKREAPEPEAVAVEIGPDDVSERTTSSAGVLSPYQDTQTSLELSRLSPSSSHGISTSPPNEINEVLRKHRHGKSKHTSSTGSRRRHHGKS
jgi:hypothetical protein